MNMYAYVHNDPVNFTDPSGLEACSAEGHCDDEIVVTTERRARPDFWLQPTYGRDAFGPGGEFSPSVGGGGAGQFVEHAKDVIDESLCGEGGTAVSNLNEAARQLIPGGTDEQIQSLAAGLHEALNRSSSVLGAPIFGDRDIGSLVLKRRFGRGYYTSPPDDNLPLGYAPGGASDSHNSDLPGRAVAAVITPYVVDRYGAPIQTWRRQRTYDAYAWYFETNAPRWIRASERLGVPFVVHAAVNGSFCIFGNDG